ncbi:hypothetical protein THRCLA_03039 [Thraustotheca clavata]|uniref:Folate receptor-like domain-containing protein n=1 Tax=Thraustotheca clavata TaxID=74557 RepID=A0A1W0A3G6_9STRA|nr:hypothetical protein THRCLA_03039 [Thraustotheca clavata]
MTCRSVGTIKFDPSSVPMQQRVMEHCSKYHKSSCCNATHNVPLKRLILEPIAANVNVKCQQFHEELACSACHPHVGTSRIERICPDLCDEWYDACKDEFYMSGNHHLAPCYGNALICSRLKDIVPTGKGFCRMMGYTPGKATDTEGIDCFDGSVPNEYGKEEPAEKVSDALYRIFQEQSNEPSEFVLLVILGTILSLFLSIKFFKRWHFAHTQMKLEETRRRQQEAYRQSYHFGKEESRENEEDLSSSEDEQ